MIHSIAVLAGDSSSTTAAQQHALRMARWFDARLRVVTTRERRDRKGSATAGRSMESSGAEAVEDLGLGDEAGDVQIESSIRGEGLLRGLLAEARECDLLVVGLPDGPPDPADPLLHAGRHADGPLLHRAESLVLAVCQPPLPLTRVLVEYQGGNVGKAALRAAGEVASRANAAITILCADGDPADDGLCASAQRYLAAFALPCEPVVERVGLLGSVTEVARAAQATNADLVVIGGERHSLLDWLTDRMGPDAVDLALFTQVPVLIAR